MGPAALGLCLLRGDARLDAFFPVRLDAEFLKELPLEHIPAALQPGGAELRRQIIQEGEVFRLALHQEHIVRDQCLNEQVVLRLFVVLEFPVDEQPL